jgi:hypothetical protein
MAPSVPTYEPVSLQAGTTWVWTKALADYPVSEGWTAAYFVLGQVSITFSATPRAETDDYLVSVAPATTATVLPGDYRWQLRMTLSGAVYVADEGRFAVTEGASVATVDQRVHAEKELAFVEAALLAFSTDNIQSYTIGSRSVTRSQSPELRSRRVQLKAELQMLRNGGRLAPYAVTY